jgi:hypothetical protein
MYSDNALAKVGEATAVSGFDARAVWQEYRKDARK